METTTRRKIILYGISADHLYIRTLEELHKSECLYEYPSTSEMEENKLTECVPLYISVNDPEKVFAKVWNTFSPRGGMFSNTKRYTLRITYNVPLKGTLV